MIYLDYQATTPLAPQVADILDTAARTVWANPSSTHMLGLKSQQALDRARRSIANDLGCSPAELFFTSGASESNNWAVSSAAGEARRHVITTSVEHKSVLDACHAFQRRGGKLTILPVDSEGFVAPDAVENALRPETSLVSIMMANNEVGSVQPIAEICRITKAAGVPLHSDATQGIAYLQPALSDLGADLVSISSHKLYGPKGLGILYVSRGLQRDPDSFPNLLHGGGQERGRRPGTENLSAILGLAEAVRLTKLQHASESLHVARLKELFWSKLSIAVPSVESNSPFANVLPNCLNFRIPGVDAGELLSAVPEIALATGSSCNNSEQKPSHVLLAMGLDAETARSSVRVGFGRFTSDQEVLTAARGVGDAANLLLSQSAARP